ncbi:MAG: hypothetical protein ACJAZO_001010 [Myxococcota bacterium]
MPDVSQDVQQIVAILCSHVLPTSPLWGLRQVSGADPGDHSANIGKSRHIRRKLFRGAKLVRIDVFAALWVPRHNDGEDSSIDDFG